MVEEEPTLFRRRQVTPGMEQEGRVQIRDGLAVGERIVARGASSTTNGDSDRNGAARHAGRLFPCSSRNGVRPRAPRQSGGGP